MTKERFTCIWPLHRIKVSLADEGSVLFHINNFVTKYSVGANQWPSLLPHLLHIDLYIPSLWRNLPVRVKFNLVSLSTHQRQVHPKLLEFAFYWYVFNPSFSYEYASERFFPEFDASWLRAFHISVINFHFQLHLRFRPTPPVRLFPPFSDTFFATIFGEQSMYCNTLHHFKAQVVRTGLKRRYFWFLFFLINLAVTAVRIFKPLEPFIITALNCVRHLVVYACVLFIRFRPSAICCVIWNLAFVSRSREPRK